MKKNIVKINETTLRRMVSESVKNVLKEGYGTPSDNDYNKRFDINTGHDDVFKDISDGVDMIFRAVEKWCYNPSTGDTYKRKQNKYEEAILKQCTKIYKILRLWKNQEIMKQTGLQPDEWYELEHLPKRKYNNYNDESSYKNSLSAYGEIGH